MLGAGDDGEDGKRSFKELEVSEVFVRVSERQDTCCSGVIVANEEKQVLQLLRWAYHQWKKDDAGLWL